MLYKAHNSVSVPKWLTSNTVQVFLGSLPNILIPPEPIDDEDHQRNWYVVACYNLSFYRVAPAQDWFADHTPFFRHTFSQIRQNPSKRYNEIDAGVIQGWTHGASSTDLWQAKILPVMCCGQTQLCGKMLPSFSSLCIFIFFFNFLFQWTVVFFCKHI